MCVGGGIHEVSKPPALSALDPEVLSLARVDRAARHGRVDARHPGDALGPEPGGVHDRAAREPVLLPVRVPDADRVAARLPGDTDDLAAVGERGPAGRLLLQKRHVAVRVEYPRLRGQEARHGADIRLERRDPRPVEEAKPLDPVRVALRF